MKTTLILIDRKGKEAFTLPDVPQIGCTRDARWIWHDGRWWGFGVGKLDGTHHYYEAIPEPQQMGGPAR